MPYAYEKLSVCADCGVKTKSISAIRCGECLRKYKKSIKPDRVAYAAEWQRKKKYAMDNSEFDAWWIVFKGKCGICENDLKMPVSGRGQSLDVVAIDHDHHTGKIRGLLCNACNKGLGLFTDSIDKLDKAKRYLENAKS